MNDSILNMLGKENRLLKLISPISFYFFKSVATEIFYITYVVQIIFPLDNAELKYYLCETKDISLYVFNFV